VMGRRTWQSLPERYRPLPGRRNLVVTRNAGFTAPGAETAPSLEAALARLADADQVFVIGGGELYAAALPCADELVLTEIGRELPGDTCFPPWDRQRFDEVQRQPGTAADGTPFAIVHYRRRHPPVPARP
jgi:dihydrofolate reductase